MPFTPYHFGPSAFFGLTLRKWLDIPVFVLANVIVDVEVLLRHRHWPVHGYFHTLLIGAVIGAIWGVAAYPFRRLFKKVMRIILIPYQTGFWKMVVSGILGVWLHIITDGVYHGDVRMFWPMKVKPLYGLMSKQQVKIVCICFFIAAAVAYALTAASYLKQKRASPERRQG